MPYDVQLEKRHEQDLERELNTKFVVYLAFVVPLDILISRKLVYP